MKIYIKILLCVLVSVFILSCRRGEIPEDIHEHEEIEKVIIRVKNIETSEVQELIYTGGTSSEALKLEEGEKYDVELDFFQKHDDHYHSMLEEIEEEKDQHFITYDFGGIAVNVKRSESDIVRTDGKKIGIHTQWEVVSKSQLGKAFIKLYHNSVSVDDIFPSSINQQGKVIGGESDADVKIDIL